MTKNRAGGPVRDRGPDSEPFIAPQGPKERYMIETDADHAPPLGT